MSKDTTRGLSVTATPAQTMEELAVLVTEQLLQPRRVYLKGRAPKDERVHQLRRDMAGEAPRKEAMKRVLTVLFADLDDGVPSSMAVGFAYTIIALANEREQEIARQKGEPVIGPDPFALIQRENRAQAVKDDAERAVVADPMSLDALNRFLSADAQYEIVNDRLVSGLRRQQAHVMSRHRHLVALR